MTIPSQPLFAGLRDRYRDGRETPETVVDRILGRIAADRDHEIPLNAFLALRESQARQEAQASSGRWKSGKPLSPLDGIPLAVKDAVNVAGLSTPVGTRFLGKTPEPRDSELVRRLKAAGAIILGKTHMHEFGFGATGINPHGMTARNPYDRRRITGGSSSGSAAAVAAGLVPGAIGTDAGGSVRIPSALCGLTGLKATFGRIPMDGIGALTYTMDHAGPMTRTVQDAIELFEILATPALNTMPDSARPFTAGIIDGYFTETCAPDVSNSVEAALRLLEKAGVKTVPVQIPSALAMHAAGVVTMGGEAASILETDWEEHRNEFGGDVRLFTAGARKLAAHEYLRAQRIRTLVCAEHAAAFQKADIIITPMTARTAPFIHAKALRRGETDPDLVQALSRFSLPYNLTGLPALTLPAGTDASGLPVGLQLIAPPNEEIRLLSAALFTEKVLAGRCPPPPGWLPPWN